MWGLCSIKSGEVQFYSYGDYVALRVESYCSTAMGTICSIKSGELLFYSYGDYVALRVESYSSTAMGTM